jgi:collagenase-like PrtC family protease
MKFTVQNLKDLNACEPMIERFVLVFGDEAEVTHANIETAIYEGLAVSWVAAHTTDKKLLEALSYASDADVRYWVALNESTSQKTMNRMFRDKDSDIRFGLAKNLAASPKLLDRLAKMKDQKSHILIEVARNRNTSSETLDWMSKRCWSYGTKYYITTNENTSEETLRYLTFDDNVNTRFAARQSLRQRGMIPLMGVSPN